MSLKIGVISPQYPYKSLSAAQIPLGASLIWFNELEACFAYLLHDFLDKIYFDEILMDSFRACTRKYQRLINQLHPSTEMCFRRFDGPDVPSAHLETLSEIRHVPTLDMLFKNGELKSVFQPIIEARGEEQSIHGIECLSRIYFDGQRHAPEFIFNYAAEKLKLTNYDKICLMQALNLVPRNNHTLIFVNVRPQTLISSEFCTWFKGLLKKNQLLPEQIVIEVTEQYCVISEQEMIDRCKALKNMGVRLAVDDFGSGISNLSMLEIMKPSYIKISGRFIKNSHLDKAKQKIIKNVLELASAFGIYAILENVELELEWLQAKALGAQFAQGFYFYKPMSKEPLDALLKEKAKKKLPAF